MAQIEKVKEINQRILCCLTDMIDKVDKCRLSIQELHLRQSSFRMGKFQVEADICLSQAFSSDGDICKVYTGNVDVVGKGDSNFIFTTIFSSGFIRVFVKLQFDASSSFEDVVQNTSLRFSKVVPFSIKRCRRSKKEESLILHIDQFHVLSHFKRKGCGSKVMAIIFLWLQVHHPMIRKCVVISPSSIGIPFYVALGAVSQNSGQNLEFNF